MRPASSGISNIEMDDLRQALELATADRHSILSSEGYEADLGNLKTQACKQADSATVARQLLNEAGKRKLNWPCS